jgi:UDP-N-acetylmuramoyl-tripeptide--D-alanyl-D-alanine ligase
MFYTHALSPRGARVVTYGEGARSGIRLVNYDPATGRVRANVIGLDVEYTLAAKGKHMALHSLAVLTTLKDRGLDWTAGVVALATFIPPSGRNQVVEVPVDSGGTFTLIDGSHNANPASMRASLTALAETPAKGRKIAVLGDILELGDDAKKVHRSLVKDIRAAWLGCVHLLGDQLTGLRVRDRRLAREVHRWEDGEQLIEALPESGEEGDLVLIKGSGATCLKELARIFLERADNGED